MSRSHAVITFLLICFIVACSPTVNAPSEQPTAAPLPQTTKLPTPTNEPISTRVERRAPTLAPTATETIVVATAIPTPTATVENSATPSPLPTNTRAKVVATAPLEKAVYVTKFQIDPPQPKSKPAEFLFQVAFLNTVGENVNYPRWRVLIFPKGQTKAVGDPQGVSKTIANGASQQDTQAWSIKVSSTCESFTAQPIWENEDGKQTPLPQPDGKIPTIEFQVCP